MVEPAEVDRVDNPRRGQHTEAMHPHQELAHRCVVLEEAGKDRPVPAVGLLPTVSPFANRAFQVSPHRPHHSVGVIDIAGHATGRIAGQVFVSRGRVSVGVAVASKQAETDQSV